MRIYHRHFRALGYCNRGLRRRLLEQDIAWGDFLANGVEADILIATGDAMALAVVEFARNEAGSDPDATVKRGGCV